MPRTVLVTGAEGFIGLHLMGRIRATTDWTVLTSAGDLSRRYNLPPADVAISLAAHVDVAASLKDPRATFEANVGIACTLVEYARAQATPPLIVHVTTAEVFGPGGPFGLHEPARPTNPYAASKAAQDAIFHCAATAYGIPVKTARTANVFGELQKPDKFVPTVVRSIMAREPVRMFGHAKRRWVHADDVADALIRLIDEDTMEANLTGAQLVENADIVSRVARRLGVKPLLEFVEEQRPGHEDVYDLVPWGLMTDSLDRGLDRAVAWWAR